MPSCAALKEQNLHRYQRDFDIKLEPTTFIVNGCSHLVTVDYFSRYIEIVCLDPLTSAYVIGNLPVGGSQMKYSVTMEVSLQISVTFQWGLHTSLSVHAFHKRTEKQKVEQRSQRDAYSNETFSKL